MRVLASALIAMASASVFADALYAITETPPTFNLCRVDTRTGAATSIASFTNSGLGACRSLVFNPRTGVFLTLGYTTTLTTTSLIEFDPQSNTWRQIGSQFPLAYCEGMAFSSQEGGLIISGSTAAFFTTTLVQLNDNYTVARSSFLFGLPDADTLSIHANGDLFVFDGNNNPGSALNFVRNPFGSQSTIPFGSNSIITALPGVFDFETLPGSNEAFIAAATVLGKADANYQNFEIIGPAGSGYILSGIAGVPWASSRVELAGFPTLTGKPVLFELWKNDALVESGSLTAQINGAINFETQETGAAVLKLQSWTGLTKAVNVNLDSMPLSGIEVTLVNGDIDGDNEVGPGDFAQLANAFLSSDGDPNWNVRADLDGDGEVGPGDFSILAENFLASGD